MKKVLSVLLVIVTLLSLNTVSFAKTGDVVGKIYSTDIKAYINGVWVDSYNIGGKTVVIIEDITNQFAYADDIRTLVVWDFAPSNLVGTKKTKSQKSGVPVGKIYETDIKTIFRGKELTAYSLNGKMAVEIEELGFDNEFSDIGGKYIWNAEDRTISLEMMYRYSSKLHDLLREKTLNMVLNEKDGKYTAEFVPVAIASGSILGGGMLPDNAIVPVYYNDDIIGYRCRFPDIGLVHGENGKYTLEKREYQASTDYYYVEKIVKIIENAVPVIATSEEWLTYREQNMCTIKQKFETDEYLFLYMSQPNTHGGTHILEKFDKTTGETEYYNKHFKSVSLYGQMYFEDVRIDEENEKVYLHYDVDYVIDLKTDEVIAIN